MPVAEVFDEERAALMPLPSTAFDPVRWESRTADKYGLVDIDSNRYLAGPDSARSKVLAAIRWDTVTLASPATGELLAEYPRQYGRSRNVEDPALVLPRLAVKPRAWRESSIRPDVPDDIRAWLDSMDEKTLRESLKAIGDACRAAGFDPAMQACGEILRSNRDMGLHADSLTPIALRMRDGEWEYPRRDREPDLSRLRPVHHRHGRRRGRTVSVRPDPVIPETRRRRASTTEKSERILKMSRSLTLTRSVLAGTARRGHAQPARLHRIDGCTAETRLARAIQTPAPAQSRRLPRRQGASAATTGPPDTLPRRLGARAARRPSTSSPATTTSSCSGPSGTGKSHLAIALGRHACRKGIPGTLLHRRQAWSCGSLRAQSDNRLDRELARDRQGPRLLVIDELGYVPIDEDGSRLLFQVVTNSRTRPRSIIYTTNIEFSGWGQRCFGDPNMAAAIIDRTVHHGRMIRFEGRILPQDAHALMTK